MFCTNCGAPTTEDAKYCANCGESVMDPERGGIHLPPWILKAFSFFKKLSLLKTLFDFSFDQFITLKMVKFLYALSILFAGLVAFFLILLGLHASTGFGMVALLVGAPLIFLLTIIYSRIFLEMVITVYRLTDQPANSEERPEAKDSIQWNIE